MRLLTGAMSRMPDLSVIRLSRGFAMFYDDVLNSQLTASSYAGCNIDDGMLAQLSRAIRHTPYLRILELDCTPSKCTLPIS